MKKGFIAIAVIVNLVGDSTALAQLSLNSVSANIGTIRTLFRNYSFYQDYQYSVYPELQISGDLLIPGVRWTAYWGYWTDGIEKPLPVADFVTYSYTSHIVGMRFALLPAELLEHWPLPIGIFTGIGYHFIAGKYVGGFGFDGKPGQDFTVNATALDVGMNAEFQVLGPIGIRGEIQQFVPLGSDEFDRMQKNRRAYKVGLALTF